MSAPNSIPPPDLSSRPLQAAVECSLAAAPRVVFEAWTRHLDRWLAAPGTVLMRPEVDTAFYFETHHGETRLPYYGRFLRLEPDQLLQLTWLSTGTLHTETVITIQLTPEETGTQIQLTHAGFPSEELRDAHQEFWPIFLAEIDNAFTS